MRLKVVLDTNILIDAIPEWSRHRIIFDALIEGVYDVAVSTEIMLEYEEKIKERFDFEVAEFAIDILKILPNVYSQIIYFQFYLIVNDPDDDKFSDCALASNAHFIVSNDKDFNILKNLDFPRIKVLKISEFAEMLRSLWRNDSEVN